MLSSATSAHQVGDKLEMGLKIETLVWLLPYSASELTYDFDARDIEMFVSEHKSMLHQCIQPGNGFWGIGCFKHPRSSFNRDMCFVGLYGGDVTEGMGAEPIGQMFSVVGS